MQSPSNAEGPATAHTVIEPLNASECFGQPLRSLDNSDLDSRQAAFISRRLGVDTDRARILVGLVFGEVTR